MSFIKKLKKVFSSKEVKDLTKDIKNKLEDAKEDVVDAAKKVDAKYDISDKFDKVKDAVEDKYEEADKKYSISGKIDGIKEKADELADEAKEKAEKIAKAAKETAEDVKEKIESKLDGKIAYDDFTKVEIKVGKIISAEPIKKSDKLMLLKVDVAEEEPRQIVSGIAKFFDEPKEYLTGKQALFVTNLEPRTIFGYESNGMIMAVSDNKNSTLLKPMSKVKNGTQAG